MHKLCTLIESDPSAHQGECSSNPRQKRAVQREFRAPHREVDSRVDLALIRVEVISYSGQTLS
jgi:hypothetical protein